MLSNLSYELEEVIGEGSMAVVYRARHRELGSLHAIKKLKVADFDIQNRLIQEGRLLANIRHPNILTVTDLVKLEGAPSLVMEYIQGPSLSLFLSQLELSLLQADALARGILNGVLAAHKKGLIHRDLKPGNILLDIIDGAIVPKVADFGLAKQVGDGQASAVATRCGTENYMSPQILNKEKYSFENDVWALACVLFELR